MIWADHVVGWHSTSASPQGFPRVGKNVFPVHEQNYLIFCLSADPFLGPDLPNKVWPEVPGRRARECVSTVTPFNVTCQAYWVLLTLTISDANFLISRQNSVIYNLARGKILPCEEDMEKKVSKKFLIPAPQIWTGPSLWQQPNKRIFFPLEKTPGSPLKNGILYHPKLLPTHCAYPLSQDLSVIASVSFFLSFLKWLHIVVFG